MKTLKEILDVHVEEIVTEMAVSRKDYLARVDGLRCPLIENWCLCKWCQLYDPKNQNFGHWITELRVCIKNLKDLDIKNGIDKRKTLIGSLIETYDYNDPSMIVRVIIDKFDLENINSASQRKTVATEFANSIYDLIDMMSDDSVGTISYIQKTFK